MRLTGLRISALERLRIPEAQQTLLWAALIGVAGALATIGFRELLLLVEWAVFGRNDGLVHIAMDLRPWQRALSPCLGGVLAGVVLQWARTMPAKGGSGDYMEAIALGDGDLGMRWSLLRALSSAATVASGGAIGREGPMVQLAALTGSLIGRWRDLPVPRRRLMVACGAAAGIATAYNAPLAGALFVAEIVLQSIAFESLGPLFVAAFAANFTSARLVGFGPVYQIPSFVVPDGPASLILAASGILAGLLAPAYLWCLDKGRTAFGHLHWPLYLKLGLGGLCVGLISVVDPSVWGNGYSVVNGMLQGGGLWQAVLLVLFLKLLAVAATTGSGAVGGVFTPTLFMGAATGTLFWIGFNHFFPSVIPQPASTVLGMGAFLAACTHAPLMSMVMVFEMTENYGVLVPLMLACALAYYVARVLRPQSIYHAHGAPAPRSPLLTLARDLMRSECAVVSETASVEQLEQTFVHFRWPHVYVVDRAQRFVGAVSLHDLNAVRTEIPSSQAIPRTLIKHDYPRVVDSTPIWKVLDEFARHPGERLPVLDASEHLLGYVTKTDLVLLFRERLGN